MKKFNLSFLFSLAITSALFAGGYRVNLQGVRQTALGLTTSVHARDASVAFYNPAGMSFIEEDFSISIGGYGVSSEADITIGSSTFKTDNDLGTPLYGAIAFRPIDAITIGGSFTTPFGSSVVWEDGASSPFARSAIETELTSYFVQPTISFKFNDWFSLGFGYVLAFGSVDITSLTDVPLPAPAPIGSTIPVEQNLESSDASGQGFNIGAFIRPNDKLTIAASYRSRVDLEVEGGDLTLFTPGSTTNATFNSNLPAVSDFNLGFSYQIHPKFLFAAEMNVEGWDRYQDLTINSSLSPTPTTIPRDYKTTYSWHVGGEFQACDFFALRGGYYYDPSPSPDSPWTAQNPSLDNHGISGGIGLTYKGLNFDLTGLYVIGKERDVVIEGVLPAEAASGKAFVLGAGLSYNVNFRSKK